MKEPNLARPVRASKRILILDALRGFALLGIAMANYPEFSLWTFLSNEQQQALSSASFDKAIHWCLYFLVDGKFYTIFSILFGIGFSIIIDHAMQRGANGFHIFFRRMILLLLIGFAHLMLIWSGDILMLYAAIGLLLPLFRHCKEKQLLQWSVFFLVLPVVVDAWRMVSGLNPADWLYNRWWEVADSQGINESNFASWLAKARNYIDIHSFLLQGAVERMWEFVGGQRYFKVLGLFLIGYYIGRRKLFQHLDEHRELLKAVFKTTAAVGLPLSVAYAWSSVGEHPWGTIVHDILYTVSIYPFGLAYISGFCLLYLKHKDWLVWEWLAYPGRMALTCYILQSVVGAFVFYGVGFGLGTNVGLWFAEIMSLVVFGLEILFSMAWLGIFNFGPLEWIWRMLTYGRWFKLKKSPEDI